MSGGAFTGWVGRVARTHTRRLAGAVQQGLTGEEALDAVQEAFATFLGLPQARTLVEADDDAFALLAVIVRNAARNARRRHHRACGRTRPSKTRRCSTTGPRSRRSSPRAEAHVTLLGCGQRLGEIQRNVVRYAAWTSSLAARRRPRSA
ncbi:MAG: sigma-70 family RNA polymerase sigma factor [bacterium]